MDDQRRPGSPHNHSPSPCSAHHENHTAVNDLKEADKRARINGVPSLLPVSPPPPSYHRSTRPRGLLIMKNLYSYVLCFCILSVAKAHSSSQSSTLFAIMDGFGYNPVLAETWKGNNPCDGKWLGIICVEGQIKYILLVSMNLTGTISPRFADLTSVRVLDLSDNFLTGTIPIELAKMRLTVLDVSYNHLHGEVPPFEALVLDGNPEIATADIVRVPLQSVDKETASVVGFYFGILVLGFLFIGGAGVLFYLAKTANHPI